MDLTPVQILAPMGRSGTNFLRAMMLELGWVMESPTSRVLHHEDYLSEFVTDIEKGMANVTANRWTKHFRLSNQEIETDKTLLRSCIGEGIKKFIGSGNLPVVLKTPNSSGMSSLDKYVNTRKIFIIRDPRNTIESMIRMDPKCAIDGLAYTWKLQVESIVRYCVSKPRDSIVTKYENLVSSPENELSRIAKFLGTNCSVDVDKIRDLPLYGPTPDGPFVWEIKPKPKNFNPLAKKWTNWPPEKIQMVESHLAQEMKFFEYAV